MLEAGSAGERPVECAVPSEPDANQAAVPATTDLERGLVDYSDKEIEPHMLAAYNDGLSASAEGGFGSVFEAVLPLLGKVVVKLFRLMLDPNAEKQHHGRQAITQGLCVLQQMRHANIPRLLGVVRRSTDGDVIGLVLPRFPYTLDAMASACGFDRLAATPLEVKVRILADAVAALAHLHDRGFIHRDVKPLNILVANKRNVTADLKAILRWVFWISASGPQQTEQAVRQVSGRSQGR
ncbi:hypothetical protein PLESTM_000112800 [Pleodorina starrii]|nr:hypothetical protein PLESTM_000112800 [Pleodorina starrii]